MRNLLLEIIRRERASKALCQKRTPHTLIFKGGIHMNEISLWSNILSKRKEETTLQNAMVNVWRA